MIGPMKDNRQTCEALRQVADEMAQSAMWLLAQTEARPDVQLRDAYGQRLRVACGQVRALLDEMWTEYRAAAHEVDVSTNAGAETGTGA